MLWIYLFDRACHYLDLEDRGAVHNILLQWNVLHKIVREDQEVFGIDWRSLERETGFDLPNLASSASFPEMYLQNLEKILA